MNAPRSGCPINLTLEALGDRWSLIVIRDLMFGNRRHFRELLTRSEEGIASNILADRLTRLEKAGLVSRRDDPSHKQKVIYSRRHTSQTNRPAIRYAPARMKGIPQKRKKRGAFSRNAWISQKIEKLDQIRLKGIS